MKRESVISSSVKSMGFENGQLEVEYANGSVYLYEDVSLKDYQEMRASPSVGRMLKEKVVFAKKPYTKINGPAGK